MNNEDIIEKILDGVDDDYNLIVDAINACNTIISFDELEVY